MTPTVGVTTQDRYDRAAAALEALQAEVEMHWIRLGFGNRAPGAALPVIDEPFRNAIEAAKRAEAELRDASIALTGERAELTRVLEYTRLHLRSHELSSASVAKAHDISVRHLNRLFADAGMEFDSWVASERLEGVKRDLASTPGGRTAIFPVAWSWGFGDPRHFSRRFRLAFGLSPAEWQAGERQDRAG